MIRVERGLEPPGFSADAPKWAQEFQDEKDNGITASQFWSRVRKRVAMREYAQQLYGRFHYKCSFCEARPRSLQIEHYRPKSSSQFEHLMFVWENWLGACPECNRNKSTRFPDCDGDPCLIDPSSEDPGEHVCFLREQILGNTERGEKTIEQIGLDRSPNTDDRTTWLLLIDSAMLLCLVPEAKGSAITFLIWAMQRDAPYSAMTLSYLEEKMPQVASPVTPHPRIEFDEPAKQIAQLVEAHSSRLLEIVRGFP